MVDFSVDDMSHTKLSVLSAGAAILGLCTKTNIGWIIGVVAGLFAIYSSILSIKEKRMSIKEKLMVNKLREMERMQKVLDELKNS